MPKSRQRLKHKRTKPIKWKADNDIFHVPANPRPTVEFPRPDSSSRIEFTLMPGYPEDHPKSKIARTRKGGSGIYNVNYILSVPGVSVFNDKLDFDELIKSGDSLLQIPTDEFLVIHATDGDYKSEIQFLSNTKGMLSRVHLRINCASFEHAERFAHERVCLMLSYWSFLFDIGIDISSYLITEESTGTRKYSVGLVGRAKPFTNENAFIVSHEHRRILAAYREGMNSSNLFYKAMGFYKVIEGTLNLRIREGRKLKTLEKDAKPFEGNEIFPSDIGLLPVEQFGSHDDEVTQKAFTKYLGKSFPEVRDDLKDLIRNAVAHLGDFDKVLDADRYDDVVTCARAIPVLKYMARKMLENDFAKLPSSTPTD
jgi:hypothetical protein